MLLVSLCCPCPRYIVLCIVCCQFLCVVLVLGTSSCVSYVVSFSVLSLSSVYRLVYRMLLVSLCCPCPRYIVLCIVCCQFLCVVLVLGTSSCVSYVVSFSVLSLSSVHRLVYRMLLVYLCCPCPRYIVLCIVRCQFLCVVLVLGTSSCVSYVVSFSVLSLSSVRRLVYRMLLVSLCCPCPRYIVLCIVCCQFLCVVLVLGTSSCVSYVVSFSVLSLSSVHRLVYRMLLVSLCCPCPRYFVLCIVCCQFLCVVLVLGISSCVSYVVSFSVLSLSSVHRLVYRMLLVSLCCSCRMLLVSLCFPCPRYIVSVHRLVYRMLLVSLCCPCPRYIVLCIVCCQFICVVLVLGTSSCVSYVVSFSVLSLSSVRRLVYRMLLVSLCCPCPRYFVLCIVCCQFLCVVLVLGTSSCVSYVVSFSVLSLSSVHRLVYRMLLVSLCFPCPRYIVLCIVCCQFICVVLGLGTSSCVSYVVSFSVLSLSSVHRLVYRMLLVYLCCPCPRYIVLCIVCCQFICVVLVLGTSSCVSYVVSLSVLSLSSVHRLVYRMLLVYLCCPCPRYIVLCIVCCQFLCVVLVLGTSSCVSYVVSFSVLSLSSVHRLVYRMLLVYLCCPCPRYIVLCIVCCQFICVVLVLGTSSCVSYVVSFSVLSLSSVHRLVYRMLLVSLCCPCPRYIVLCIVCCQFLCVVLVLGTSSCVSYVVSFSVLSLSSVHRLVYRMLLVSLCCPCPRYIVLCIVCCQFLCVVLVLGTSSCVSYVVSFSVLSLSSVHRLVYRMLLVYLCCPCPRYIVLCIVCCQFLCVVLVLGTSSCVSYVVSFSVLSLSSVHRLVYRMLLVYLCCPCPRYIVLCIVCCQFLCVVLVLGTSSCVSYVVSFSVLSLSSVHRLVYRMLLVSLCCPCPRYIVLCIVCCQFLCVVLVLGTSSCVSYVVSFSVLSLSSVYRLVYRMLLVSLCCPCPRYIVLCIVCCQFLCVVLVLGTSSCVSYVVSFSVLSLSSVHRLVYRMLLVSLCCPCPRYIVLCIVCCQFLCVVLVLGTSSCVSYVVSFSVLSLSSVHRLVYRMLLVSLCCPCPRYIVLCIVCCQFLCVVLVLGTSSCVSYVVSFSVLSLSSVHRLVYRMLLVFLCCPCPRYIVLCIVCCQFLCVVLVLGTSSCVSYVVSFSVLSLSSVHRLVNRMLLVSLCCPWPRYIVLCIVCCQFFCVVLVLGTSSCVSYVVSFSVLSLASVHRLVYRMLLVSLCCPCPRYIVLCIVCCQFLCVVLVLGTSSCVSYVVSFSVLSLSSVHRLVYRMLLVYLCCPCPRYIVLCIVCCQFLCVVLVLGTSSCVSYVVSFSVLSLSSVLRLVYRMLLVSLCCPCPRYIVLCIVCCQFLCVVLVLGTSSCVSYVVSFSVFSLSSVHRLVYRMLLVYLCCPWPRYIVLCIVCCQFLCVVLVLGTSSCVSYVVSLSVLSLSSVHRLVYRMLLVYLCCPCPRYIVLCIVCCQFICVVLVLGTSSCVSYVVSLSVLSLSSVHRLVYRMLLVSLCCPCPRYIVLCIVCCQFLCVVLVLGTSSCVSYVVSLSVLSLSSVHRLVYRMLLVYLCCSWPRYIVLCIVCCQFLCVVLVLGTSSCVSYVVSFSVLSLSSVHRLVYRMLLVSLCCPCPRYIVLCIVCCQFLCVVLVLGISSCVSYVVSFSVLSLSSVHRLVYRMLLVSLCCSCPRYIVLCIVCCQFLCVVLVLGTSSCVSYVVSLSVLSLSSVHRLVYRMLLVSLCCPCPRYVVLCIVCCQFLCVVLVLGTSSCVSYVVSLSVLSLSSVHRLVYRMLLVSLCCPCPRYIVLCIVCCQFLCVVLVLGTSSCVSYVVSFSVLSLSSVHRLVYRMLLVSLCCPCPRYIVLCIVCCQFLCVVLVLGISSCVSYVVSFSVLSLSSVHRLVYRMLLVSLCCSCPRYIVLCIVCCQFLCVVLVLGTSSCVSYVVSLSVLSLSSVHRLVYRMLLVSLCCPCPRYVVLCIVCCQFLCVVLVLGTSSCVSYVVSFSVLSLSSVHRLVYRMLLVSLCCPCPRYIVLCIVCCQFLCVVLGLGTSSCASYVVSFSVLSLASVHRLVYRMLLVYLCCPCPRYIVLCIVCCQFLCVGLVLGTSSCVSYVVSFSVLSLSSVHRLVYRMLLVSLCCPCPRYIVLCIVCCQFLCVVLVLGTSSCVSYVVSLSVLSLSSVHRLVYRMLLVYLCCPCPRYIVLCILCCQFICVVLVLGTSSCVSYVVSLSVLSLSSVHRLVYRMLLVSLCCPCPRYIVLCIVCCQFLCVVLGLGTSSCVSYVVSFSVLSLSSVHRLVYRMLLVSLCCSCPRYIVLCIVCCKFLCAVLVLGTSSCVSYAVSFSVLFLSSVHRLVYRMLLVSLCCPCPRYIVLCIVCCQFLCVVLVLGISSCVSYVVSFSVLSLSSVHRLVYRMLLVSLCCSCPRYIVLCIVCCQFLCVVLVLGTSSCVSYVVSLSVLSLSSVHCLVYRTLLVSLCCPCPRYVVLCIVCCQFLCVVLVLGTSSCVSYVVSFSVLSLSSVHRLVYRMLLVSLCCPCPRYIVLCIVCLLVSLCCPCPRYIVLCIVCCQFLCVVLVLGTSSCVSYVVSFSVLSLSSVYRLVYRMLLVSLCCPCPRYIVLCIVCCQFLCVVLVLGTSSCVSYVVSFSVLSLSSVHRLVYRMLLVSLCCSCPRYIVLCIVCCKFLCAVLVLGTSSCVSYAVSFSVLFLSSVHRLVYRMLLVSLCCPCPRYIVLCIVCCQFLCVVLVLGTSSCVSYVVSFSVLSLSSVHRLVYRMLLVSLCCPCPRYIVLCIVCCQFLCVVLVLGTSSCVSYVVSFSVLFLSSVHRLVYRMLLVSLCCPCPRYIVLCIVCCQFICVVLVLGTLSCVSYVVSFSVLSLSSVRRLVYRMLLVSLCCPCPRYVVLCIVCCQFLCVVLVLGTSSCVSYVVSFSVLSLSSVHRLVYRMLLVSLCCPCPRYIVLCIVCCQFLCVVLVLGTSSCVSYVVSFSVLSLSSVYRLVYRMLLVSLCCPCPRYIVLCIVCCQFLCVVLVLGTSSCVSYVVSFSVLSLSSVHRLVYRMLLVSLCCPCPRYIVLCIVCCQFICVVLVLGTSSCVSYVVSFSVLSLSSVRRLGQGQHRETNNIRYTRRRTEDKDNTEKLTTYDTQDDVPRTRTTQIN